MAGSYKLSVAYGDGEPQTVGEGLADGQAEQGLYAFLRDMLHLEGSVVTKIVIERQA